MSARVAKTQGPWPIRQWCDKEGVGGFIVEDDQGYNFSFPTRAEAESFRTLCFEFQTELAKREGDMVRRFRDSLRA